uniref:Major sperm protein n=1 Tax=Parascaris univalens TaxID=6257 RepID=A0A915AA71_PARUN
MFELALKIFNAIALPIMAVTTVLFGCGDSSRPKQSRGSKSISKKKCKSKSGASSKSSGTTQSSKKRPRTKKRPKDRASSARASTSRSRSSSRKEVVDSSALAHPIGAQPQREMMIEPTELRWSTTGGMQKVLLINPSKERRAVKVKCSDNNLYRVNPVFSFVEPGHSLSVDIVRQNGGAKVDKMIFVVAKAEPDDTQPRTLFQPGVAHPMMVLPLIAK